MAPWSAARSLLAAAVCASFAVLGSSQAAPPPVPDVLQLTGACDARNFLNSVLYDKQGYTANGSPYFKARGIESYIYYDADCAGGGDGMPRWILDNDRPNLGFITDLDGDFSCEYQARINSHDGYSPPFTGTWKMECGGGPWQDQFLIFLLISTTSTTTTTRTMTSSTRTGTTATRSTLTRSGTRTRTSRTTTVTPKTTRTTTRTTTSPPPMFVFGGACEFKGFLNGLVFREEGTTANGSPYFKALTEEEYLYYDLDCDGGSEQAPMWIFDSARPALDRLADLNGDGRCDYHARLESDHAVLPPDDGTWTVFCGETWTDLALDLNFDPADVAAHTPTIEEEAAEEEEEEEEEEAEQEEASPEQSPTQQRPRRPTEHDEKPPRRAPQAKPGSREVRIAGACEEQGDLNEVEFVEQGVTETGAPYYMSLYLVPDLYIYYDPACAGPSGDFEGRWVLDADRPDLARHEDLDGDRRCEYQAAAIDNSTSGVPAEATWRMRCGDDWEDVTLTIHVVEEAKDEAPPITSRSRRGAPASAAGGLGAAGAALAAALLASAVARQ